jgi:ATP phosphoribosyltransferase regulatory subunit
MAERIPSGTRDVLPDEMRELRALTERVRAVFDRAGYGEVYTPALEYERAAEDGAEAAYRTFDEHGNVLVLRSDMTVPIARLVGTRYPNAELPLRFDYFAHSYRSVRAHRGLSRELLQAGIELIGAPGPAGTVEVLTVLCDALDAVGLTDYRVGLGDATLYPMLLLALGVPEPARRRILGKLSSGDFVGVEREVRALPLPEADAALALAVPRMRGGPSVFSALDARVRAAGSGLRGVSELLPDRVAARVIFDFGLLRSFGYYTGAVFQVYDPAHGEPLGQGGRYDELLGQFGRPLPAVGFALNVESLHIALARVADEAGTGAAEGVAADA